MTAFRFAAAGEQFTRRRCSSRPRPPRRRGFDALAASDHFAPWWSEGRASQAWITLAAIGRQAAEVAARWGDGPWTLGDPEQGPEVAEAYRSAGGREEIIHQAGFALGSDGQATIDGTRMWKATQLPEVYKDPIPDPADMRARAEEQVSDESFAKAGVLVGADPDEQVARIREMEQARATVACLQCIGDDPLGSIRRYGERVLPALRGAGRA